MVLVAVKNDGWRLGRRCRAGEGGRRALAGGGRAARRSSGSRASRMNSALVVSGASWVRRPWRQFQRRQVTPASSHHTTSPGSGCSTTGSPSATVSNGSVPVARTQAWRTVVGGEVLTAERDLVEDADGVVEVGERVDSRKPGARRGAAAPRGCCGCVAASRRTPGTPRARQRRAAAARPGSWRAARRPSPRRGPAASSAAS